MSDPGPDPDKDDDAGADDQEPETQSDAPLTAADVAALIPKELG